MAHIHRLIRNQLLLLLGRSPVVFLNGPRQAGKSTLVQSMASHDYPAEYVTFDNVTQMAAAANAPETYLKNRQTPLIIDEVQLVPEIFRTLKTVVDELRQNANNQPQGRFLLTGSANILALPELSNALVGRMSVLTLYPLSSAEAQGGRGDFIERLFLNQYETDKGGVSGLSAMQSATFPEISSVHAGDCAYWFDGYVTTILQRDVRALADIEKLTALPNLLRILAHRAGGLVNDADIARDARLNSVTTRNYKTLLKMLFLAFEIKPWYRNIGKRLVKAPKSYMIDTQLLCYLLQYNLRDLELNRPEIFGNVLENFVATELMKLMSFSSHKVDLYHFRTSDQKEVDFVIEKPNGTLAALEVKSRDHVTQADFKGLCELQKLTGDDFVSGIVLYRGKDVVPFGKNLWAVPISNLWS